MNRKMAKKLQRKLEDKQIIANLALELRKRESDVLVLKEIIACCSMMAAENNDRKMVDLTRRVLKGFSISPERYREIIQEFKQK
jgi:Cys-tRNA synthase (O-phospho-L-seryl-tRNA:Cys-tRNA synthase)